jgi:hypothetical protein
MAALKAKARKALASSSFVYPSQRRYPIHDRAHAANALARARQSGSATYAKVHAVVCRRHPSLPACKRTTAAKSAKRSARSSGARRRR